MTRRARSKRARAPASRLDEAVLDVLTLAWLARGLWRMLRVPRAGGARRHTWSW